MTFFVPPATDFAALLAGETPSEEPKPTLMRAKARRAASLKKAEELLAVVPGPGEALHGLIWGRFQPIDLMTVLLGKLGDAEAVFISTLGYNRENVVTLLDCLDSGAIKSLTMLCSKFFQKHNEDLWEFLDSELTERGQRLAASRTHAKIIAMDLQGSTQDGTQSAPVWMTLEGSANLRTCSAIENFLCVNDLGIFEFHRDWIERQVKDHATQP